MSLPSLGGLVVANVFLKFGENSREIWIATALGPILGSVLLVAFAGGPDIVLDVYRLNAERSVVSPYVILTGDGPWHRYLVELLTLSPLLFLFFVAGAMRLGTDRKAGWFLLIFFVLTYAPMAMACMNLRYTTIWSLPMAWFAALAIWDICRGLPQRAATLARGGAVALLVVSQILLFRTVFVADDVYDPTPQAVQRALSILKDRR